MTTDHDPHDLLAAYALDAVEPAEAEVVELHLASCPQCRAEVAAYREVTSVLAYSGGDAPPQLWDRIAAGMQDPPPPLRLDRIRSAAPVDARHRARRRFATWAGAAVATAAAVAAVVLGVDVSHLQNQLNAAGAVDPLAPATMADVRAALDTPGRRVVTLSSAGSPAHLDVVLLSSGLGYLYDSDLAPLPAGRTYQLWGLVGHTAVSYGLLGTDPRIEAFRTGRGVGALAVTDEVASGVSVSHQRFTVSGDLA
jgi:hypothetical protein